MYCDEQATYLRELNRRGDSEAVVRIFEGGQVASSEATLGEYVKALVAVDRLDTSSLIRTLQVVPNIMKHVFVTTARRLTRWKLCCRLKCGI